MAIPEKKEEEEIQVKNPKGAVTTDPAQGHITSYFRCHSAISFE